MESELNNQVDFLFVEYFKNLFETSDKPGYVEKLFLTAHISEKFSDDDTLQEMLNAELDKHESPENVEGARISENTVKLSLRAIMKGHMKALIN